uniref:Amiloride-sensitive sodium channel n=1 Tax=Macrostomum lignano TaxID=282301 RepID=A0A1I8G776_9PLAT
LQIPCLSRVWDAADWMAVAKDWKEMIARFRAMLLLPNSSSVLTATERQFNVSDREDCINSYIVQQFIENCNCLPSILPVKVDLFDQYSYCFEVKDIRNLSIDLETRYNEQVSRINQYEFEAMKRCQSPCRTDGYSVRYVTYPWPNLKTARSIPLLEKLASNYGYPTSISELRGVANFYQVYLKSESIKRVPFANQSAKDILSFEKELESLQNRLARLTVQAWTSSSQEITEEEAYPTKNLVADIGGALGLWSGISILTLCELLELLIYISRGLARRTQQNPSRERQQTAAGGVSQLDPEAVGLESGKIAL